MPVRRARRYPEPCRCGGLVHAAPTGDEDAAGNPVLVTGCDICGRSEDQPVAVPPASRGVGQPAFTGMVVPLASGALGSVIVTTPSLNIAVTLPASTAAGMRIERTKAP